MALAGFPFPDESLDAIRQDEVGMYATRCVGWRVVEMAKILRVGLDAVDEAELRWPKYALDELPDRPVIVPSGYK